MLHYTSGDIFESHAEAIVNTVNTEGIMGKGLALQFKKKFPDNFKAYEKACKEKRVRIGHVFTTTVNTLQGNKYIINFPTKASWKNKSKLVDIEAGLKDLVQEIRKLSIKSIAIPPLGCGLGGLAWEDVRAKIEAILTETPNVDIYIYAPLKGKNPRPATTAKALTPGKALLLEAFTRYMTFATSTAITFVEAHKIAYLLQAIGVPLRLQFAPWRYGPYAKNLSHVLSDMEGVWIDGYRDGTAKAFDTFRILPSYQEQKKQCNDENTSAKLNILEDLIEGFESPIGLELLGTVHWLITHEKVEPKSDPIAKSIAAWCDNRDRWGDRKIALFKRNVIEIAIDRVTNMAH